jgi:hypothetical protein
MVLFSKCPVAAASQSITDQLHIAQPRRPGSILLLLGWLELYKSVGHQAGARMLRAEA